MKFIPSKAKLVFLWIISFLPIASFCVNTKPFVIPELKTWMGSEGMFMPTKTTRIVVEAKQPKMLQIASLLATDYEEMFGLKLAVTTGKPSKGDIILTLAKDKELGEEGYMIAITDKVLISAPRTQGIYWATRTLLQMSEQDKKQALPCGVVRDWPDYPMRGFMLDCGRKYFPIHALRDYVKILSYYKMNTFHIHLNDNGFPKYFGNDWNKTNAAFRLECNTYPGLTARDGHYTKQEFVKLQLLADSLGVEIIPEIDIPAHSLAFTHYKPEIGSKEYGPDHLDLFNPETYTFLDALFKEYLEGPAPVFRGKRVHIGTDEYSNKSQEVVEKFRYFTDRYIKYVESFGKEAMIWGQQTHAKGKTPIKVDNVLMHLWSNGYAQPQEMMDLGYDVVSIPDGQVYIVPLAGYYFDYLNTRKLYETWTPADINGKSFPERHPQIKGSMFAVWNDVIGNGISTHDVHYRFFPAMQTLAVKMWTGAKTALDYDEFNSKRNKLSEAPGVNVAGKYPQGEVLELPIVRQGETLPIDGIGWNYKVSFDIEAAKEQRGTILFSSPDAEFYLTDPASGKLGFIRDGYLNTFDYSFYPGEKAKVAITGDEKQTSLYVNDKLIETLGIKDIHLGGDVKMKYISTLTFPLKKVGDKFKSKVTNFKVESGVMY